MTELEKELTIKVKRLEDDCKAYNFTQHTLQEKIKELKAQIEKMKCCQNCLHLCARCELGIDGCYVCSKWELRR